ncbi:hypothetical protein MANES_18G089333v8 [Manihot esculenta]|uniref:Uncharacterized protein n=1 Tax=Manihot esculenta TaxID=3983 RepID=A0ACB7FZL8_MANES|nr:hypothetical protein MANES_18G089333v8 [Manihot esculenta]
MGASKKLQVMAMVVFITISLLLPNHVASSTALATDAIPKSIFGRKLLVDPPTYGRWPGTGGYPCCTRPSPP